jgi:hypothetical protein
MEDARGDGWNGNALTVTSCDSSLNFVVGLSLSRRGQDIDNYTVTPEGTYLETMQCLPAEAFRVSVGGGYFPSEVAWSLSTLDGWIVRSGGAPLDQAEGTQTYPCPTGMKGSRTVSCSTGLVDLCVSVTCDASVASLPTPANAQEPNIAGLRASNQPFGSALTFSCNTGYSGPARLICSASGVFEERTSCVPVTCDGSRISPTLMLRLQSTATPPELIPGDSPGVVYRRWSSVAGVMPSQVLTSPGFLDNDGAPDVARVLDTLFEAPDNVCDNCATVISGFFRPVQSGKHIFKLSSDSGSHLYLGVTKAEAEAAGPISMVPSFTKPRQWDKDTSQTSAPKHLSAGFFYYIEAIANEGSGPDHLAVAVVQPDGTWAGGDGSPIPVEPYLFPGQSPRAYQAPNQPYGTVLRFPCKAGWYSTEPGGAFLTLTCAQSGQFVAASSAFCMPITCDASVANLLVPLNAQDIGVTGSASRYVGQGYRTEMTFPCSKGYTDSVRFVCDDSRKFVTSDSCKPILCDGRIGTPVGTVGPVSGTADQLTMQPYGSTLIFPCAPNHTNTVTGESKTVYTCQGSQSRIVLMAEDTSNIYGGNWSNSKTTRVGSAGFVHGPWGNSIREVTTNITVPNASVPVTQCTVSWRSWSIDSRDGEIDRVRIDGVQVWSKEARYPCQNGWQTGPSDFPNIWHGNQDGHVCYVDVHVDVPCSQSITITFASGVDDVESNEAWAFSGVKVMSATGTFQSVGSCAANKCDGSLAAVPTPQNGDADSVNGTAVRAPNQPANSMLTFDCTTGYSGSITLICDANKGTFVVLSSTCTHITCDGRTSAVPVPNNAQSTGVAGSASQAVGQPYSSTLRFACSAGFQSFAGYDRGITYICGLSGTFSTNHSCRAVTCDGSPSAVATPTNAAATGVTGTATQTAGQNIGSTLVFACSGSYSGNSVTYTCLSSGLFATTQSCGVVTCDGSSYSFALPTPNNALSSGVNGTASRQAGQAVGSTLIFGCSAGFSSTAIAGSGVTYTCSATGVFTTFDACTPVTCDGRPSIVPAPKHTTLAGVVGIRTQAAIGSTIAFKCSAGYTGTVTYRCSQSGLFVTDQHCIATTCNGDSVTVPTPAGVNQSTVVTGTATRDANQSYGSQLIFHCSHGFAGTVTYSCSQSGQFGTTDTCQSIQCDPSESGLPTPVNAKPNQLTGTAAAGSGARTSAPAPIGATLIFRCALGYQGSISYTCTNSGTWVTADSSCSNITCNGADAYDVTLPPRNAAKIVRGTAMQSPAQPYMSTLVYPCANGYYSAVTYTCSSSAMSTGRFQQLGDVSSHATCAPITCDGTAVPTPWNAHSSSVTGTAEKAPSQKYHSTLIFKCAQGFSGHVVYTCKRDAHLAKFAASPGVFVTADSCRPVECDGRISAVLTPSNVMHTGVAGTATRARSQPYGSKLEFPCGTGYRGTMIFRCGQSGIFERMNNCTNDVCYAPAVQAGSCTECLRDIVSQFNFSRGSAGSTRFVSCLTRVSNLTIDRSASFVELAQQALNASTLVLTPELSRLVVRSVVDKVHGATRQPSQEGAEQVADGTQLLDYVSMQMGQQMTTDQLPLDFNNNVFSLEIQKFEGSSMAAPSQTIDVGPGKTVKLPNLPQVASESYVTSQVIVWTQPPFAYTATSQLQLSSQVVTVNIFSRTGPIVVKNLEEPIIVKMMHMDDSSSSLPICDLRCKNAYDIQHGNGSCLEMLHHRDYSCEIHFCAECPYARFCDASCRIGCEPLPDINVTRSAANWTNTTANMTNTSLAPMMMIARNVTSNSPDTRQCRLPNETLCAYWDTLKLQWISDGRLVSSDSSGTVCSYTHLTDFGVVITQPRQSVTLPSLRITKLVVATPSHSMGIMVALLVLCIVLGVLLANQNKLMKENGSTGLQDWRSSEQLTLDGTTANSRDYHIWYKKSTYHKLLANRARDASNIRARLTCLRLFQPLDGDPHTRTESALMMLLSFAFALTGLAVILQPSEMSQTMCLDGNSAQDPICDVFLCSKSQCKNCAACSGSRPVDYPLRQCPLDVCTQSKDRLSLSFADIATVVIAIFCGAVVMDGILYWLHRPIHVIQKAVSSGHDFAPAHSDKCDESSQSSGSSEEDSEDRNSTSEFIAQQLKRRLRSFSYTSGMQSGGQLFAAADFNNDGKMSFEEFCDVVRSAGQVSPAVMSDSELELLFLQLDEDGSLDVDVQEFSRYVFGTDDADDTKADDSSIIQRTAAMFTKRDSVSVAQPALWPRSASATSITTAPHPQQTKWPARRSRLSVTAVHLTILAVMILCTIVVMSTTGQLWGARVLWWLISAALFTAAQFLVAEPLMQWMYSAAVAAILRQLNALRTARIGVSVKQTGAARFRRGVKEVWHVLHSVSELQSADLSAAVDAEKARTAMVLVEHQQVELSEWPPTFVEELELLHDKHALQRTLLQRAETNLDEKMLDVIAGSYYRALVLSLVEQQREHDEANDKQTMHEKHWMGGGEQAIFEYDHSTVTRSIATSVMCAYDMKIASAVETVEARFAPEIRQSLLKQVESKRREMMGKVSSFETIISRHRHRLQWILHEDTEMLKLQVQKVNQASLEMKIEQDLREQARDKVAVKRKTKKRGALMGRLKTAVRAVAAFSGSGGIDDTRQIQTQTNSQVSPTWADARQPKRRSSRKGKLSQLSPHDLVVFKGQFTRSRSAPRAPRRLRALHSSVAAVALVDTRVAGRARSTPRALRNRVEHSRMQPVHHHPKLGKMTDEQLDTILVKANSSGVQWGATSMDDMISRGLKKHAKQRAREPEPEPEPERIDIAAVRHSAISQLAGGAVKMQKSAERHGRRRKKREHKINQLSIDVGAFEAMAAVRHSVAMKAQRSTSPSPKTEKPTRTRQSRH